MYRNDMIKLFNEMMLNESYVKSMKDFNFKDEYEFFTFTKDNIELFIMSIGNEYFNICVTNTKKNEIIVEDGDYLPIIILIKLDEYINEYLKK